MQLLLNEQTWLLVGVFAHLVAAIAKALVHTPRQQAQIDSIETKLDAVIAQVAQAATQVAQATTERNT